MRLFKKKPEKAQGFFYDNRDFLKRIQDENRYFLDLWLNSQKGSSSEKKSGLKSFVVWLNDTKNLCESKGEDFSKWFNDCIADEQYIAERTKELNEL